MQQAKLHKECKRCHQTKLLTEFSPKKKMKLGVHSFCKECMNKKSHKYRESNKRKQFIIPENKQCAKCKQLLNSISFAKDKASRDGLCAICKSCKYDRHRSYVEQNQSRDIVDIPNNKTCASCKQLLPKTNYTFNRSKKDGLSTYCKNCFKQKTSKYNTSDRTMKRYNTDPVFKLKHRLRGRVKDFLRRNNCGKKLFKTLDLIGCTAKQCFDYLEKLWWPGMSWSNMGKRGWHIDHIIPLNSFDLTKPEEQKKAFHYTNLQPLWEHDNLSKNKSVDWTPSKSQYPLPERLKSSTKD